MKKIVAFVLTVLLFISMCAAYADNNGLFSYSPGEKTTVDKLDINEYIEYATEIFDEIKANIDTGVFPRKSADQGKIEVIKDPKNDAIRRLTLFEGSYDSKFNKSFYYDNNENLVFVLYDSTKNGSHRMYVYEGTMVYWKETPKDSLHSIRHSMEKTDEYFELQEQITNESETLLELVKGTLNSKPSGEVNKPIPSGKMYDKLDDLPNEANNDEVNQIAKDWISYPPTDADVYPIKKEITIKAGEKTRLELFRNEKGEAGTFDCVWYFSDANVTFDWAGGGTGWSGHTLIGYITADKPCTIFAYFESESGKIAHMVVYVK